MLLSPHGRPSVTMAHMGRTAASTRSVSGCSDGTCPRFFWDKFHLEHLDHHPQPGPALIGVRRCAAAPSARTQRPCRPASPRPRANLNPLLPSQVARSSPPSPPDGRGTTARGPGRAATTAPPATSLSTARGGASSEVRLCGACAYVPCMTCALTLTNPLLHRSNCHYTTLT